MALTLSKRIRLKADQNSHSRRKHILHTPRRSLLHRLRHHIRRHHLPAHTPPAAKPQHLPNSASRQKTNTPAVVAITPPPPTCEARCAPAMPRAKSPRRKVSNAMQNSANVVTLCEPPPVNPQNPDNPVSKERQDFQDLMDEQDAKPPPPLAVDAARGPIVTFRPKGAMHKPAQTTARNERRTGSQHPTRQRPNGAAKLAHVAVGG